MSRATIRAWASGTADELDQKLVAKRRKIVEIRRLASDVSLRRLVRNRRGDQPARSLAIPARRTVGPALPFACGLRPCRFVIKLDQNVLRELEPERTRAADVGDRLDLGASERPRLAKCLLRKRPAGQKRLRPGQPEHRRPDPAVSDRGRLDSLTAPPETNARAKGGDVHFLAFGDLVELDDFVGRRERDQHAGDDLVGREDGQLRPRVKLLDGHAPGCRAR